MVGVRSTGRAGGAASIALGAVLGVSAVAATATLATGAIAIALARRVITPPTRREEDERILSVDLARGEIVLVATEESRMRGRYSFWFDQDAGHARLGDVIDEGLTTVRRRIESVDFGRLERARRGRFAGWLSLGPWELGHAYENVTIATELGPAPAWHIPAAEPDGRWVVMVHGRATRRQEALRAVDVVRASGRDSLIISYRNDGEAPESDDRRYGLGGTEWPDVEAAVRFAIGRGAREIVLMGWSMGGATVLQAALRSEYVRAHLGGIVLESPAIDWLDILRFQGQELGLPAGFARTVTRVLGGSWSRGLTGAAAPVLVGEIDPVARAGELEVPILLLHSVDDGFVPIDGSRRLAQARPDLIDFEEWQGARHTKLWNQDPERWNRQLSGWLDALPAKRAALAERG